MSGKIIKPSTMPLFHGDVLKRTNLFRWIREFMEMQNFSGYYLEFGVLNGECMIDAYRQLRGGGITHWFGFDSFEGLPELSSEDLEGNELTPCFHQGNYRSMQYELVRQVILSSSRMQSHELTLVKGNFDDVLPLYDKRQLQCYGVPALVYIDCDLYSSATTVLQFIDDIVVTGTWILFDDYWTYRGSPHHGEQRAIYEWMRNNNRIGLQDYGNFNGWGKAFIAYEK